VVAGAGGVVTPASVQVRLLPSVLFKLLVQLLLLMLVGRNGPFLCAEEGVDFHVK
jgi:hypothetical protein